MEMHEKIKELISIGKIEKALVLYQELAKSIGDSDAITKATFIASQFHSSSRRIGEGLTRDYSELNRIVLFLLESLSELENHQEEKAKVKDSLNVKRNTLILISNLSFDIRKNQSLLKNFEGINEQIHFTISRSPENLLELNESLNANLLVLVQIVDQIQSIELLCKQAFGSSDPELVSRANLAKSCVNYCKTQMTLMECKNESKRLQKMIKELQMRKGCLSNILFFAFFLISIFWKLN